MMREHPPRSVYTTVRINVVDHSRDDVPDLAWRTVKITPLKGKHIVEHTTRRLEADAVFYQVAFGFGSVPLEIVFVHNVRSTRSLCQVGQNRPDTVSRYSLGPEEDQRKAPADGAAFLLG